MKQNTLGTKILMAVLTLGVVAYFVLQGINYFGDPLSTAMAYTYHAEKDMDLSGYVVREEQVIADDTNGLLQLQRAEGERVSAGGVVAAVYADQASLDRQSEIEALKVQIEQLQFAQEAALGAEASMKLDAKILRSMQAFREALEEDRLDVAEDHGAELRALIMKRDYSLEDTSGLQTQIQELQAQLKTLRNQAANSTRRITAPQSGIYSAVVDGYETVLKPAGLKGITPSQLADVRANPEAHSGVGKLILGEDWYYAATVTAEQARKLQETSGELASRGKCMTLKFSKNVERGMPVLVDSVGPVENGRCVVVFQGQTHLSQLTQLRQQTAKIISSSQDGIRIPKEALRANQTTLDEETGKKTETKQTGIYCVVGKEAWFKPVKVLYNGDGFLLVKPAAEDEKNRLRPGDEVIVAARDLYNGKVVR